MKKVFILMLALIMVLGIVGCSSAPAEEATSTPQPTEEATQTPEATEEVKTALSYEEMLENAESIELSDIYAAADDNALRAEQEYVGNIYRFGAFISEINKEYFTTPNFVNYGYSSIIQLADNEDLINLSTDNTYEVVGTISSIDNTTVIFENAYVIDVNSDFVLDGIYYSATGIIDPSKYDITVDEYFERNPQKLEENLSEDDDIDLFVFATLNASDEGNIYLPLVQDNGELPLELTIGKNKYSTGFKVNDFENRISKFFDGYDDGYSTLDQYNVLEAGSSNSAEIMGLFFVEYGVYKEAVENNAEITLSWGGRYTITSNAQDIIKIDSVSAIAEALNN